MRKKIFTILLALTASIGMMWAETVVVINKSEFTSSGVTKEGVTLALSSGSMTSSDPLAMNGSFEFSTSLGKFTGITIETDANIMQIYEGAYTSAGWPTGQNLGTSAVWTGESETVLISCMVAGMNTITITCTIEPAPTTEDPAGPIVIATNTGQSSYTQGSITVSVGNVGDSDGFRLNDDNPASISNSGSSTISKIELVPGWFLNKHSYVRANGAEPNSSSEELITFLNVNSNEVTLSCSVSIYIKEVRIYFEEPQLAVANTLQLHVNDALMGSVAVTNLLGSGIVDNGDGTYDVPEGAEVTLQATPNEGYEFIGWKASSSICDFNECEFVALSTVNNPLTVDMYMTAAFMAEFAAVAPTPTNPEIKLNGNFSGEWADTEAFEVVEQPMDSYAKLTKLLEPGTYEFGVKVNGELRANGSAYTRENYSYIIEEGHTGNLTINVDVKGYYSFYWYYDNNRLINDYSRVCGMYWKDVTAGNFEVTLGQEGEVTLPKVWATSMAFVANIANGTDQVRLGSTDETVATIAYTLSMDGLGTLTFHQAGECDIYVVHDITNLYCYDSCAFHLTVHPAPTTAVEIGDLNEASEVETFLTTYDGQTVPDLTIDRPVLNNMYNTLCLPFHMDADQIANSSLNGVEIYEFVDADVTNDELYLYTSEEKHEIVAGRPYLVKFSAASQLDNLDFVNVTINNADLDDQAVTIKGVTFKGTFQPIVLGAQEGLNFNGGHLFLAANNTLYWPNTNNPLKPFRAYFTVNVDAGQSAGMPVRRGMPAHIGGPAQIVTGVDQISNDQSPITNKVMINGALYIIRGDKMYDAQGQVIK